MSLRRTRFQIGFTLVEAVVVITITGIVAAIVAVFVKNPILAYIGSTHRADLTDIADTAVRRIARDIQNALPNSVRTLGTTTLEFIPIKAAARYRADYDTSGTSNPLWEFCPPASVCPAPTNTNFDVYGPPITLAAGDWIVIYNLGIPGSDVYAGTSRRAAVTIGSVNNITFAPAGAAFPFSSPSSRFQVVNINSSVSYVCQPDIVDTVNASNGFLYRYYGYPIQTTQPTQAVLNGLPGATKTLLATHVSGCTLNFSLTALQSMALVSIDLQLTEASEVVQIQHQVNMNNTP